MLTHTPPACDHTATLPLQVVAWLRDVNGGSMARYEDLFRDKVRVPRGQAPLGAGTRMRHLVAVYAFIYVPHSGQRLPGCLPAYRRMLRVLSVPRPADAARAQHAHTRAPPPPQGVDGAMLVTLNTSEGLKEFGVASVGHRTVLKKLVAALVADGNSDA